MSLMLNLFSTKSFDINDGNGTWHDKLEAINDYG